MAKKKKHRKKSKLSKAKRSSQAQSQAVAKQPNSSKSTDSKTVASKPVKKSSAKESKATTITAGFDTNVRADVKLSLSLLGVIIAVYTVLWFILQYSSFGKSLYSLIKL